MSFACLTFVACLPFNVQNAEVGYLEEISSYRALQIKVNGQIHNAIIEPLNYESFALTEIKEQFGGLVIIESLGQTKSLAVEDTFFRSDEMIRTVSDRKISLVLGEDFFEKKIVALDYFHESIQVFEPNQYEEAQSWLKSGSVDDEPTIIQIPIRQSVEGDWVTDGLTVDGEKWTLAPQIMDSDTEQASQFEPPKISHLWDQYGSNDIVFSKSLWRNVTFLGQPLPFFWGAWTKVDKDLPGLKGTLSMRDLGSRRLLLDKNKQRIFVVFSSPLEQTCAALSSHVFRFPVRLVGRNLTIGRMPRFDQKSEESLCSEGVIQSVDTYTGEEIVAQLLGTNEQKLNLVRDLIQRSKQRITVQVLCKDGKTRYLYINSLLTYGG